MAKAEILDDAKKQLVIIIVKRMNEEAAAERKRKDIAKMAEEKAKGNVTVYEGKGFPPNFDVKVSLNQVFLSNNTVDDPQLDKAISLLPQ